MSSASTAVTHPVLRAYTQSSRFLSCDIFDTAIRRQLARPEDVLLAIALYLEARGVLMVPAPTAAQVRQHAERQVRQAALMEGREEPALEAIWQLLVDWHVAVGDARTLARMEFEADRAVCTAVPEVRQALSTLPSDKRLIFISDNIYPGHWLRELLQSCGYEGAYEVVSSFDMQASKHSGRIYPLALNHLGAVASEVAHLGDNPHSDVNQARQNGLSAFQWPRQPHAAEDPSIRKQPLLLRLLLSHWRSLGKASKSPTVEDGGFHRLMTPLLLGWAHFCVREALRTSRTTLWLLARDTWLLQPFINAVADQLAPGLRIRYLVVSRASLAAGSSSASFAASYLRQEGFLEDERPGIVDLGWRGSLPTRMAELHPNPGSVQAYFLGLWPEAISARVNPANSSCFLFSFDDQSPTVAALRDAYLVLEALFSAPQPSVKAYAPSPEGAIWPVSVDEREDVRHYRQAFFTRLQAETTEDLAFCIRSGLIGLPDSTWIEAVHTVLQDALLSPSFDWATALNRLPYDGYSGAQNLVRPLAWYTWLLRPRHAIERMDKSPWRSGLLRLSLPRWLSVGDWPTWRSRLNRLPWS